MALIATVGTSDANSYLTVEEAQAYFDDRAHSEDWDACDNQSAAIVTASKQLDWYAVWKGLRSSDTQSMEWPRKFVTMQNTQDVEYISFWYYNFPYEYYTENYYDSTIIPPEVKQAVCEFALASLAADRTTDLDFAGISQIKAGPISVTADIRTNINPIPDSVWKVVRRFIDGTGRGNVRIIRG